MGRTAGTRARRGADWVSASAGTGSSAAAAAAPVQGMRAPNCVELDGCIRRPLPPDRCTPRDHHNPCAHAPDGPRGVTHLRPPQSWARRGDGSEGFVSAPCRPCSPISPCRRLALARRCCCRLPSPPPGRPGVHQRGRVQRWQDPGAWLVALTASSTPDWWLVLACGQGKQAEEAPRVRPEDVCVSSQCEAWGPRVLKRRILPDTADHCAVTLGARPFARGCPMVHIITPSSRRTPGT